MTITTTSNSKPQLSWNDLKVFHAFAQTGSINSAARHLDVDNSTVSRRLQDLEKQSGVMLVERTSNGYRLTREGSELKQLVNGMAEGAGNIHQWLKEKESVLSGRLTLSCCDISMPRLSTLIRYFQEQHPDTQFTIEPVRHLHDSGLTVLISQ
ncbi:LysR family transcriptional regulator [Veronia nyctiphanis]|nr:LysR family transcriptional regulator [Veronia nyctiphanis]